MAIREVRIPKHQAADVAYYFNMGGRLYISIRTRDGSNQLDQAWWITWGLGSVTYLGLQKTYFETKIPVSWWKGGISAKLRARAGGNDTILYISEDAHLDKAFNFEW